MNRPFPGTLWLAVIGISTAGGCDRQLSTNDVPVTRLPPDLCQDLECGAHGTCAIVGGSAVCDCAPGYRLDVDTCVEDPVLITPTTATIPATTQIDFDASGGVTPYAFSVESGGGSIDATTGVYTAPAADDSVVVRVTDTAGAIADANVTVELLLAIVPSTVELAVDNSEDFDAVNGTPPYTFSVESGGGSIDSTTGVYAADSTSGAATVRVTDALAEFSEATVTINAALQISPATETVAIDNVSQFSATGGVPPYAYSVDTGGGIIDASTGSFTAPNTPGTTTVRVTDARSNTSDATVTVNPSLQISPSAVTLAVNNIEPFSVIGGVPPYVYSIQTGGGIVDAGTGNYTAPASTGSATVRVTDALSNMSEATVTVNPALQINPTALTVAVDHAGQFSATGGVPTVGFSIQAGGGSVDAGSGVFTAPSSAETVTVRATDARGNTSDAAVDVILPVVTKTVGGAGADFTSVQSWEDLRGGDLTTRAVLGVSNVTGTFTTGETITGPTCSGDYVPENEAGTNTDTLTLDGYTGACATGDTLTGGTSGATATYGTGDFTLGAIEKLEVAAGSVYDEHILLDGAVTDADHYLWITAAAGDRHDGTAGTGVTFDPSTTGHVFDIRTDFTRIEWLEITGWENVYTDTSWEAVHVSADGVLLQYLLIHDDSYSTDIADWNSSAPNPNSDAINLNGMNDGESVTIRNCIIYNISRSGILRQDNAVHVTAPTATIENVTILRAANSGQAADGSGGISFQNPGWIVNVYNSISLDSCTNPARVCTTNVTEDFFDVDGFANAAGNLSADVTAPGSGAFPTATTASEFVEPTIGIEDLHIKAGADAVDNGVDRTGTVVGDIDNQPRPRGSGWDIGSDEL